MDREQDKIADKSFSEEIFAKSPEYLNEIMSSIPHPFYVIDAENYRIKLANRAGAGEGETCHERTHQRGEPCKGDKHPCGLEIVKKTGKSFISEHVHFDKNGNEIFVEVHNHPVFDRSGKVSSVIEYAIEITDKVREREKLKNALSELTAIYDVVPLMICLLDKNRRVLQANSPFCSFFGIPENEIRGKLFLGDLGCINIRDSDEGCGYGEKCGNCKLYFNIEDTFRTEKPHKDIEYPILLEEGGGRAKRFVLSGSTAVVRENSEKKLLLCLQDITEKRDEEERLRNLTYAIEQSPVTVAVTDLDGNIEYVNRRFTETTGYTKEEVLGKNPRILKSGHTKQHEYEKLWQTITSGKEWRGTFHNKKKNGELYWESAVISPVFDSKGKITRFLAVKEDITRRKELEERINLFAQALDAGSTSMVIADAASPDYPVTYVNQAFEKMTGYSSIEVVGRNCRFLQGGDRDQPGLKSIREGLEKKQACWALLRNYRRDGSLFWNEIRITPVKNESGVVTHFVGVSDDVTELKRIQGELIVNEERLRLSQQYANIGTWDLNIQSGALHCSERIAPLLGIGDGELEITYETLIGLIHPEDREKVSDAINKCIDEGIEFDVEHRRIWPSGEVRWLHQNGNVVRDDYGIAVHMLGLVQDITERKRSEHELLESREAARSANMAKSEFLSSMSHELRTPMNAIIGFSQLLDMDDTLNENHKDYIKEIMKAGYHLLDLINEILDLSKIETGKVDLSLEPVFCREIVEECITLVASLAEKYSVALKTEITETCVVEADRVRLKQVLLNLLSNAIKYNRPGGEVVVKTARKEKKLVISVYDTGTGIPFEKQKELFQPFSRLGAESTEIEGTGIGLTISKKLVEMMKGEIEFESEPGRGSVFKILLPARKPVVGETSEEYHEESAPDYAGAGLRGGKTHKVLYIEDNPANLRLVQQIFEKRSSVELITAHEPYMGLDLAEYHKPDLILLDLNMPEMDGYRLLKKLQSLEWGSRIPVVAITAHAMPHDIEKGLNAGFTGYLTKPLDIPKFLQLIDTILSEKKEEKNNV